MSKRSKRTAKSAQGNPSAAWGWGGSGFSAADQSQDRGYVYFPALESEKEMQRFTREEIIRKAKWLHANDGISRKLVSGLSAFVGPQRPQPATSDREWNMLAKQAFDDVAEAGMIHDVSGREDFYARQMSLFENALIAGDAFVIFTKTSSGNPATAFYEGSSVYTPSSGGGEWRDGVAVDRNGRPQKYAFRSGGNDMAVIDAVNVVHFGLFSGPKAPRGQSVFTPAANRLLDVRELDNDTIRGIKAANLVGFYMTSTQQSGPERLPMQGATVQRKNPFHTTGGAAAEKVTFDSIFSGGGNVMPLGGGQELKTIHDDRRHPNQQAVIDHIIRSVAWGTNFPYEALYAIGGLTGPAVRYVLKQAEQAARKYRSQIRAVFCQRFYAYAIASLMKQGRLRKCRDTRWWQCEWIGREAITIDMGREWSAELSAIQQGGGTFADWYAEASQDWQEQFRKRAEELRYARELEAANGLEPGSLLGTGILATNQPTNQSRHS